MENLESNISGECIYEGKVCILFNRRNPLGSIAFNFSQGKHTLLSKEMGHLFANLENCPLSLIDGFFSHDYK